MNHTLCVYRKPDQLSRFRCFIVLGGNSIVVGLGFGFGGRFFCIVTWWWGEGWYGYFSSTLEAHCCEQRYRLYVVIILIKLDLSADDERFLRALPLLVFHFVHMCVCILSASDRREMMMMMIQTQILNMSFPAYDFDTYALQTKNHRSRSSISIFIVPKGKCF